MYLVPATDIDTHVQLVMEGETAEVLVIKDLPNNPARKALISELTEILKGWRLVREPGA